ncbi:MAG: glycine cleavage system protein GcvH [Bacteroidales bacterium]|jgi:glycine cleavage system H protein|nr:glycine cleavage system protein GcvH [Bacteroidales bacterium]MDD2204693.1 glycine cleavage system protein GcvH [Bacteroidales bacterium]MDD3152154.1 glycine cleavage system protein GcvH [Bacteroidales bacterium]MDD3914078.1 glycine cleavage system protein GcvH [Bacteroidales bacterium]MDD4634020.1 glycine cleavage system protein GcvH [Bacteroidales bacterium]
MNIPEDLKFTKDHEWLKIDGDLAVVGITDYAQSQLGDIAFVEVETVGEILEKEESLGTIEAVKTVSEVFMPVGGEILEFNELLQDDPALINTDPYGEGWIVKVKITDIEEVDELLSAEDYENLLDE